MCNSTEDIIEDLHRVTPPIWELQVRSVRHSEEDDDSTKSETRIERRGEDIIILGPPGVKSLVDDLVEDEVDDVPTAVVDTRSRRDVVRADEDERPVDLADKLAAGSLPEVVRHWRQDEPDPEEMQQAAVYLSHGIETRRANQSPDDGTTVNGTANGAAEAIRLVLRADTGNIP